MDRRRRILQFTTGGWDPRTLCFVLLMIGSLPDPSVLAAPAQAPDWNPGFCEERLPGIVGPSWRGPVILEPSGRKPVGSAHPPVPCPRLRTRMHARTCSPRTVACIRTVSSVRWQGEDT